MITLVLAFHNHQPVGNFGWVIEDAYQRAYLPLMEILEEFPSIRFAQHYTGILLDWFAEHHPEFIDRVAAGVRSGRIELLSGGYYEPILAMLPERDRRMQIERLNSRITGTFGTAPRGMWLAERIWEPSVPSTLHDAAIAYTILDDTHFKAAGLDEDALRGHFLTEDQGKPLAVLPIDKRLRYTMPFEAPEATIDYLRSLDRDGEDRVVVFADDGEKFGVWPDTWRTVYEHGWLRSFCSLLVENAAWLRTVPPGEVVATRKPAGRLYLPTASYAEMLHWALPTPEAFTAYESFEHELQRLDLLSRYNQFVRGGFWRNFMVKYPEINAMQKKMLRLSERIERARRHPAAGTVAGTAAAADGIEQATIHLLSAQCNCPYWHGVFGGIYLANIRMAMYRAMIAGECAMDDVEAAFDPHGARSRIERCDYDLDGEDELIYQSREASLYLAPAAGGGIYEFDYKPARYNFIDLLQRHREGYHARLTEAKTPPADDPQTVPADTGNAAPDATANATGTEAGPAAEHADEARSIHDIVRVKESGLEKILRYDTHRHGLFVDHLLAAMPTVDDLTAGALAERGMLPTAAYDASWTVRDGATTITLTHEHPSGIRVEKAISIAEGSADVHASYLVQTLDGSPLEGWFGIEMSMAMSAGTEPDRYFEFGGARPNGDAALLNSTGSFDGTDFALVDEWLRMNIRVAIERSATILRSPIETVSLSEEGFERNYQGSVILMVWPLGNTSQWRMQIHQHVAMINPHDRVHPQG